ncbi:MAG: undecaprenyl-phosphate galactose phosphotransferase WbaP [Lentisphaeria bacterium]|nr:undecaprenyl-phosphate galactose phosphotransferase WbaP [Lentisphaeria bacterium]
MIRNQGRLRVWCLLLTDIIALYAILAAVLIFYKLLGADYSLSILGDLWPLPAAVVLCNLFARVYCGSFLYPGGGCSPVEELRRLTMSVTGGYALLFAYLSLTRSSENYTRLGLGISMCSSILLLPIFRYVTRILLARLKIGQIPVLIAGAGKTGRAVGEELKRDRFFGFQVAGYLDDEVSSDTELPGGKILGNIADCVKVAGEKEVDYLVSALPLPVMSAKLDLWLKYFPHILIVPADRVFPILWTHPLDLCGLGSMEISNHLKRPLDRLTKILFELIIATLAIVCLFPVGVILAVLVKCSSRGPVFYRAKRLGVNGRPIEVWKFRTMYKDADQRLARLLAENPALKKEWDENFKLKEDPRITPLGKILRKTSLDELPQFVNVLRGEMAVIGPRPIVEKEVAYYGRHYEVFSRVKPGITGFWQVSGRSETTYERRIALDMYYINNWSIWLDYYIFLKTIKEVLTCRGAK